MTEQAAMSDLPPPGWKPEKTPFQIRMEKHLSPSALKSPVSHQSFFDLVGKLIEEIRTLRTAIRELQDRPQLEYLGTWDQAKVYGSGKFVTDGGSVWYSKRASVGERPGAGNDAFVLAVKKGKDAR